MMWGNVIALLLDCKPLGIRNHGMSVPFLHVAQYPALSKRAAEGYEEVGLRRKTRAGALELMCSSVCEQPASLGSVTLPL